MSLAVELHNNHKAIHQRIAAAAEAHKARKRADAEAAQAAALEKYLASTEPEPIAEPKREPWFHIVKDDDVVDSVTAPSIDEIQRATCRHFGLSRLELLSKRRHQPLVHQRQIALYLCKTYTLRSLPEIGRCFGGMDHSTILHAFRKTEQRMRDDWRVAYDVASIEKALA